MTKPNYRIIKDYPLHKIGDVFRCHEGYAWVGEDILGFDTVLSAREISQLVKDGWLEEVNNNVMAGVDFTESIEQLDEIVKKLKLSLHIK